MHYSVNCVRVSIFCSQYGKLIYMKVRYTYRLRPGKQAERYLLAEWDACRYVWNQMVEESQRRYKNGQTFGPNEAMKHLTHLRHTVKDENGVLWLAAHSSVPQQQIVRGFSSSRKKALRQYRELKRRSTAQRKDAANKWAVKVCRNSDAIASEDFKPKFLSRTTMARKAQDAAIGQLIDTLERQAVKRGRRFVKVNPAYTTQDCSNCGARAKHRLGLQDRVYKCECCGFVLDRDRNSAINMLIGAGFIPGPIGTLSRSDAAVHCCAVPEKAKIPRP